MNIKNKGLSLLVLIITIIIMLVLASAVILSLTDRNPILKANETKVKTDMAAFKLEWSNYCSGSKFNELSSEKGFYSKKLNVDKSGNIIYRGEIVNNDTVNTSLKNILPSTIGSDYEGKVFVAEGQLYIDNREKFLSEEQQKWIEEVGVHVLNEGVILIVSSEKVNLKINKKDRIYATVLPDSDKEVSFTMPENRFVQLLETDSSSANVLGTKEGSATLKASVTSDDGITVEKNIVINVNSKGYVYITDITINPSEVEIGLDEMIQLQAKLVPENADIQYVDWVIQTQSDNNVIDLSDSGLVTGKK